MSESVNELQGHYQLKVCRSLCLVMCLPGDHELVNHKPTYQHTLSLSHFINAHTD